MQHAHTEDTLHTPGGGALKCECLQRGKGEGQGGPWELRVLATLLAVTQSSLVLLFYRPRNSWSLSGLAFCAISACTAHSASFALGLD